MTSTGTISRLVKAHYHLLSLILSGKDYEVTENPNDSISSKESLSEDLKIVLDSKNRQCENVKVIRIG